VIRDSFELVKLEKKEEIMSASNQEPGHGDSLAAWVTVTVIIVAFALGTLFFWFDQAVLVWASAGLALVGLAAGWYLKRSGYGVGGSKSKH
jgi:hypothetical protein